jgi:hypothetical protein
MKSGANMGIMTTLKKPTAERAPPRQYPGTNCDPWDCCGTRLG